MVEPHAARWERAFEPEEGAQMNVEGPHTQETGRDSLQLGCGVPGVGRWEAGLESS